MAIQQRENILAFKQGDIFGKYKITSKSKVKAKNAAKPLGEGGSGVVYLAEQVFIDNIKVKRALKFFLFRDDIAKKILDELKQTPSLESTKNFNEEIVNISSFNHENIIKIVDGGILDRNDYQIPYIVTDYIDGDTLSDFIQQPTLFSKYISNDDELINFFVQICKGLMYLHKNNFYHCDIAPKNIFIKGEKGDFQLVIGDLGVGKTISSDSTKWKKEKIAIIGSKSYMSEKAQSLLYKFVQAEEFLKLQPEWDLYSLKKTFEELLKAYEKYRNINSPWYHSLKRIINKPFIDLKEIAENIERQRPIHRQFHGVPELSEADSTNRGKKQLQPIKPVWITNRVKKIVTHPLFLRLKKVPQILSSNTFNPGTNYSRYEHSLGTYENMRQVLITLLRKEEFIGIFTKSKIELALVAAMLSSISKFPLSFVVHEIRVSTKKKYFPNISQGLLANKFLDYIDPSQGIEKSLWDTISEQFPSINRNILYELLTSNETENWGIEEKAINYLLNSSVDVRVLDFLQRDSYHVGISSNLNFDLDSLIEHFTTIETENSFEVLLGSRGVIGAEQLLTLRYWLYKRIYWNSPNRSYMVVMKYILMKLYKEHGAEFESDLIDHIIFADLVHMFHFLEKRTKKYEISEVSELLNTIAGERQRSFKEIFVLNQSESDINKLMIDCDSYSKLDFDEIEALRIGIESVISKIIPLNNDKINILIDVPVDDNNKLGQDIKIQKHDKTTLELKLFSGIVGGIIDSFDENLKFLRVYIHPDYGNELKDIVLKKKIGEAVKNYLKNRSIRTN